jgi:hypothetical protein
MAKTQRLFYSWARTTGFVATTWKHWLVGSLR